MQSTAPAGANGRPSPVGSTATGAGIRRPIVRGAGKGSPWLGALAVVLAAAPALVEAFRMLAQHSPGVLWGDQALLDLASHRAAAFHQLRGVYSRYGFHEPGPAVFYVLAPFVSLLGGTGRGAFLGSAVMNATAAGAVAWLMLRRFGVAVGLWSAAVMDMYALFLQVRLLRQPWNPYLIVVPMVLFTVLWVLSLLGTRGSWTWLSVVGSYEVQTHLATGIYVIGMVSLAAAVALFRASMGGSIGAAVRDWWWPGRLVGAAVLVAIWVPTVVEVFVDRPNNVALLWRFFSSPHLEPSLRSALGAAASAISVLPLGDRIYRLSIHRSHVELAADAVALVALSVIALAVGRLRRQPAAAAFVGAAGIGVLAGAYSLSRAAGAVMMYFALWLSFVPVAVLLAVGVAFFGRRGGVRADRSVAGAALATVALAAAVPPVWIAANLPPAGSPAQPVAKVTEKLASAAQHSASCRGAVVYIDIGRPVLWSEAAGIASVLARDGCVTRALPRSWDLQFGDHGRGLPVRGKLSLYLTPGPGPADSGRIVAVVGNQVLTWAPAHRPGPAGR